MVLRQGRCQFRSKRIAAGQQRLQWIVYIIQVVEKVAADRIDKGVPAFSFRDRGVEAQEDADEDKGKEEEVGEEELRVIFSSFPLLIHI